MHLLYLHTFNIRQGCRFCLLQRTCHPTDHLKVCWSEAEPLEEALAHVMLPGAAVVTAGGHSKALDSQCTTYCRNVPAASTCRLLIEPIAETLSFSLWLLILSFTTLATPLCILEAAVGKGLRAAAQGEVGGCAAEVLAQCNPGGASCAQLRQSRHIEVLDVHADALYLERLSLPQGPV